MTSTIAVALWGRGISSPGALDAARDAAAKIDPGALESLAAGPLAWGMLALGLALWLAGDRLFRPLASIAGSVLGATLALAVIRQGGAISPTSAFWGLPPEVPAIGLGAILGLVVGALLYRVAVGLFAAGSLAAAACAALLVFTPGAITPPDRSPVASRWTDAIVLPTSSQPATAPAPTAETSAFDSLTSAAEDAWSRIDPAHRRPVAGAMILAALVGFAAGLIRPRVIAPAIASGGGAALWLAMSASIAHAAGVNGLAMPHESPIPWLAAWFLAALVGLFLQTRARRPRPAPAEE